jgi:HPt (histidine-containing phosphotransfer) domain-containing protein
MTANAMQGDREKCLAAGMDDYISKPVTMENLKSALDRNSTVEPEQLGPVLNLESLQRLKELGEPGELNPLIEFIDLFLADTPVCLEQIKTAAAQRNAGELRRLAHSLKGSAGNLGAERLSTLCNDLETAARNEALESASPLILRIEAQFEHVKVALEQQRASSAQTV